MSHQPGLIKIFQQKNKKSAEIKKQGPKEAEIKI